jgi:hypothetical protein
VPWQLAGGSFATSAIVQVIARKIYGLLDILINFTSVTSSALDAYSMAVGDNAQPGTSKAAAHKAVVLAKRFNEAVPDITAVLAGHEASRVAGTEHAKLLDALNFSGFYSDVAARSSARE